MTTDTGICRPRLHEEGLGSHNGPVLWIATVEGDSFLPALVPVGL